MTAGPSSRGTAQRPRGWANRQPSLPPPPRRHPPIPPVPRVPQHLRTHQSFPARDQARRVEAGVVRPISVPFAFEADLVRNEGAAGDRHFPIPGPMEAAPRSHHRPNMGLGGALLATVSPARRHALPRAHRERQTMIMDHDDGDAAIPPTGGVREWRNFPGLAARLAALFGFGPADDVDLAVHDLLGYPDSARQVRFANRPPVEDYNTSYTHPDKPAGGFSHDFAQAEPTPILDLSSGGSSSKPVEIVEYNTLLVCAKCQDPLILNAPSNDARTRRVFALRCGHMVDGKCVEKLIEEAESLPGYPLGNACKVNSKGKGKGKAKEMEVVVEAPAPESSIRSRLRSHASATMVIGSAPPPSPTCKKHAAGKGKGKAKAKDVIEDQREWVCPVDKCDSKHCSIKMDGLWVPAKENGPIALFL